MPAPDYKQYTEIARRGIKGEAFFESLIVDRAIPHRIARQNDLGVDFLCEWIHGDRPTGILFSAQVKASTSDRVQASATGKSRLNLLDEYTLVGAEKVDERTINYWKGLGLPAFLFYVVECGNHLKCYHKRYTPLLDGHSDSDDETGTRRFYRVSNDMTFLAFAVDNIGGFARDLVIDYARMSYSKGHVVPLIPSELGFWPFTNQPDLSAALYFDELVGWNRAKIKEACDWATAILNRLPAG
jgi:hypothetical protein